MNFTRTKTNKNQSKKNQSKVKTAFGKPAVFSYQETMSAGRRLEGVQQGQSHSEVYGGSDEERPNYRAPNVGVRSEYGT